MRGPRSLRHHWALTFLAVVVAACGGSTGPTAGTLRVELASPHGDDGALLMTVSGGPIDSVESDGQRVYTSRVDAKTLRFIVAGTLTAGTVARIHVPDMRQAASYTAVVTQAAARGSYLQRDPALYTLSLTP